ncbi:hypothetical protein [Cyanobium sp. Morenito 9A2]|uniref:hypothetical protein n=1 Tax=Cyanobium sp. Morenito 9A2 TaxID=2823718 RepID=UPI0020CE4F04|nr:hypothetical protein [Cyanobium sp. Morenito 9A2]MCP9849936.1 hypothetical protein [Cyanobium sp. Morenito 9A2]
MIGLYDHQGLLRFVGRDRDACQDYVELFELEADAVTFEPLGDDGGDWVWAD